MSQNHTPQTSGVRARHPPGLGRVHLRFAREALVLNRQLVIVIFHLPRDVDVVRLMTSCKCWVRDPVDTVDQVLRIWCYTWNLSNPQTKQHGCAQWVFNTPFNTILGWELRPWTHLLSQFLTNFSKSAPPIRHQEDHTAARTASWASHAVIKMEMQKPFLWTCLYSSAKARHAKDSMQKPNLLIPVDMSHCLTP